MFQTMFQQETSTISVDILYLPTKANLKTWKTIENSTCNFCKYKYETQHHIVSDCPTAVAGECYTWRHNSVLYTIASYLSSIDDNNAKVYEIRKEIQNTLRNKKILRMKLLISK